jgi:prepilin-type N-terminal cleavage/methylation domain-containing protein
MFYIAAKLKAFTLMEMLIGLAISAILIGIVYSTYLIVGNTYSAQRAQNALVLQTDQLNTLLYNDFNQSDAVFQAAEDHLVFEQADGSPAKSYHFAETYIIRKTNELQGDTFRLAALNILSETFPNRLVKSLQFEVDFLGTPVLQHFSKTYSADVLMKMDHEHSN